MADAAAMAGIFPEALQTLQEFDPEVAGIIEDEKRRQWWVAAPAQGGAAASAAALPAQHPGLLSSLEGQQQGQVA